MKIVQLITKMDTIGGAQIHVRDLAIGMKQRGHFITLMSGEGENIHEVLVKEGIPHYQSKHLIRELNLVSDLRAFIELRKIVKELNPDLLATHSSKAGIIGRLVGWSLGVPTVFTAHGWSFTEGVSKRKRVLYRMIEKVAGIFSNGVITVSQYDYKLARKHNVVSRGKLQTIHNGVHDCSYLKRSDCFTEDPIIMMVARFAVPKKQLNLVKALQKIQSSRWQLHFVGDGPLLQETMDYVQQHGLSDRVVFLGNRHDVIELLQQSDVFVLLSDWEGLPLSILEAMRSSLPIIASDVGGVKEAVQHMHNGYLIPKNDEAEVIQRLTDLLSNSALRLEMGQESRKLFEANFTFKNMLEKTNAYYEKIVEEKSVKFVIPRGGTTK